MFVFISLYRMKEIEERLQRENEGGGRRDRDYRDDGDNWRRRDGPPGRDDEDWGRREKRRDEQAGDK